MPKMPWSTFVDRYPVGHLVVAGLPAANLSGANLFGASLAAAGPSGTNLVADGPPARNLQSQLSRLLGRLGVSGDYSLAIVRSNGHTEIHAGFETPTDADRLAQIVHAKATDRYPGWGSQRLFVLDEATSAAIEASLAVEGELDER